MVCLTPCGTLLGVAGTHGTTHHPSDRQTGCCMQQLVGCAIHRPRKHVQPPAPRQDNYSPWRLTVRQTAISSSAAASAHRCCGRWQQRYGINHGDDDDGDDEGALLTPGWVGCLCGQASAPERKSRWKTQDQNKYMDHLPARSDAQPCVHTWHLSSFPNTLSISEGSQRYPRHLHLQNPNLPRLLVPRRCAHATCCLTKSEGLHNMLLSTMYGAHAWDKLKRIRRERQQQACVAAPRSCPAPPPMLTHTPKRPSQPRLLAKGEAPWNQSLLAPWSMNHHTSNTLHPISERLYLFTSNTLHPISVHSKIDAPKPETLISPWQLNPRPCYFPN